MKPPLKTPQIDVSDDFFVFAPRTKKQAQQAQLSGEKTRLNPTESDKRRRYSDESASKSPPIDVSGDSTSLEHPDRPKDSTFLKAFIRPLKTSEV